MKAAIQRIFSRRALLCAWIVGLVEAVRIAVLARLPDRFLVCHVPDDAFYYFQAARNFARLGRWSFDGVEPSSGFHLLWGYLLALFYLALPKASFHTVFLIASVVESGCLALAAFLVTRTAERFAGPRAFAGVLLVMLSASSLRQGTWLMESGPAILSGAAILYLLARPDDLPRRNGYLLIALALGFATTLSRSDGGLLIVWFFLACVYRWLAHRTGGSMLSLSGAALTGAIAGLVLVTLHTHWISGQWVQASAQQKLYWATISGRSVIPSLHVLSTFFNPVTNVYTVSPYPRAGAKFFKFAGLCTSGLLLLLIMAGNWMSLRSVRDSRAKMAVAAALLTVASYCVFYRYNSTAVQDWYVGNYEAPVALLAGLGVAWFSHRYATATVVLIVVLATIGIATSFHAIMPYEEAMWRAGTFLGAHPERRPAGAWNAGIMGYFAGEGVVNMDGLMNDAILPYVQSGHLQDYLLARRMTTLFEFPQIWKPDMAARGGYANGVLPGCIVADQDIFPGDPDNSYDGSPIKLYTLDLTCLASGQVRSPRRLPPGKPAY